MGIQLCVGFKLCGCICVDNTASLPASTAAVTLLWRRIRCSCYTWIFLFQDPYPTRSIESLDLMESMFLWLLRYGVKQDVAAEQKLVNERQQVSSQLLDDSTSSPQKGSPGRAEGRADPGTPGGISGGVSGFTGSDAQPQVLVSELWLSVLQAFTRISLEANEHLRNHAVVILHR